MHNPSASSETLSSLDKNASNPSAKSQIPTSSDKNSITSQKDLTNTIKANNNSSTSSTFSNSSNNSKKDQANELLEKSLATNKSTGEKYVEEARNLIRNSIISNPNVNAVISKNLLSYISYNQILRGDANKTKPNYFTNFWKPTLPKRVKELGFILVPETNSFSYGDARKGSTNKLKWEATFYYKLAPWNQSWSIPTSKNANNEFSYNVFLYTES